MTDDKIPALVAAQDQMIAAAQDLIGTLVAKYPDMTDAELGDIMGVDGVYVTALRQGLVP